MLVAFLDVAYSCYWYFVWVWYRFGWCCLLCGVCLTLRFALDVLRGFVDFVPVCCFGVLWVVFGCCVGFGADELGEQLRIFGSNFGCSVALWCWFVLWL